jgi:hypothetical protein
LRKRDRQLPWDGGGGALGREFDDERARIFGTPEEIEMDLRSGNVAFAEAAIRGD